MNKKLFFCINCPGIWIGGVSSVTLLRWTLNQWVHLVVFCYALGLESSPPVICSRFCLINHSYSLTCSELLCFHEHTSIQDKYLQECYATGLSAEDPLFGLVCTNESTFAFTYCSQFTTIPTCFTTVSFKEWQVFLCCFRWLQPLWSMLWVRKVVRRMVHSWLMLAGVSLTLSGL